MSVPEFLAKELPLADRVCLTKDQCSLPQYSERNNTSFTEKNPRKVQYLST